MPGRSVRHSGWMADVTPEGRPETEREATVLSLDGLTAQQAFDHHLDGCMGIAEAAEAMGVPVLQLVRWCGDGTVPEGMFRGRALRPGTLRFERGWVEAWVAERGEARL